MLFSLIKAFEGVEDKAEKREVRFIGDLQNISSNFSARADENARKTEVTLDILSA